MEIVLAAEVKIEVERVVRIEVEVDGARACEVTFVQLPCLLGRQFTHDLPAFTQAQPLHKLALLHLQHTITVTPMNFFFI